MILKHNWNPQDQFLRRRGRFSADSFFQLFSPAAFCYDVDGLRCDLADGSLFDIILSISSYFPFPGCPSFLRLCFSGQAAAWSLEALKALRVLFFSHGF